VIASSTRRIDAMRAALLLAGVAGAMQLRILVGGTAGPAALPAGAAFAAVLLLLAWSGGRRPAVGGVRAAVALGAAGGVVLCVIPLWLRMHTAVALPVPALDRFVPWAGTVVLISVAEEAVLRGVLFDAVSRVGGDGLAVIVAAAAFAVLHVPLYGWQVVPVDLGAGIWLGCLRVSSGRATAPAIAHAVADLATWWIW
jgi:membrane protease YdiL (CAAX protease family)